ncbi:FliM/FliN family flagellar motor switch protein [Rhodopirellula sp. JC740]|uniref:FliM/FliN family flagellar motor switch protein n=1 Tax=Rhodopirellula halodulae TaxID=2894198 RepID=A0ABS8NNX5_9BACT|nr:MULTISPECIES: FliM/FliN family flagellar motor switch protein [unclassified Rhodopirellula]MCC9645257.1 FliM/FliN family flagellar motor switch protein [Rhodopirellula sp. JC740]MCC9655870.1 FliM/FliN family flagellar motor switch protein [Rhodopirellula sp. JC737]
MSENATQDKPTEEAEAPASNTYREKVLNIRTIVNVTLAEKKEPLKTILSLVPGSMLTFDVSCDQPLELRAGGHPIATGETVKIGDKFGLRIREIGVPQED